MRGVPAMTIPFVLLLMALPALACASLPDSIWIQGIYDHADSDEAVMACLSATAVAVGPLVPAKPVVTRAVSEGPTGPPLITAAPGSTFPSRVPLAQSASHSAPRIRAAPGNCRPSGPSMRECRASSSH